MEEIKLNMKNLTKEEREQFLSLVEKANKKEDKVWKPEGGDEYFLIDDKGELRHTIWGGFGSNSDQDRYFFGNCFKTKEEAEFALERQKLIAELERFAKEYNENKGAIYLLGYDNYLGQFNFVANLDNLGNALPRFTSPEVIQAAIKQVGADRLKKYYFGIKR